MPCMAVREAILRVSTSVILLSFNSTVYHLALLSSLSSFKMHCRAHSGSNPEDHAEVGPCGQWRSDYFTDQKLDGGESPGSDHNTLAHLHPLTISIILSCSSHGPNGTAKLTRHNITRRYGTLFWLAHGKHSYCVQHEREKKMQRRRQMLGLRSSRSFWEARS